ncbi:MAG: hypothetical protein V7739_16305 [Motiliproteus sp.]
MSKFSIILLIIATAAAAAGQLLLRVGARDRAEFIDFINLPIFSGLVLYAFGTVIWIYALSFEKLVNVYAFTALTFVLVYGGGVLFLGETLSRVAIVGILLMMAGLYLITSYNG